MTRNRGWTKVLGGLVAGAAAMYVLDPDRGRRRRAIARDRLRSAALDAGRMLGQAGRDVRNRTGGLWARIGRRRGELPVGDRVLAERARAEMGRVVSNPRAVGIAANEGSLTVTGHIVASELGPLMDTLNAVPGVERVEQRLEVHETTEGVPSLQGGAGRRQRRAELAQQNWTPSLRVAAILAGSVLAALGARQRNPAGLALAGMGVGLTARGVTNWPFRRMAGLQGPRTVEIRKSIHIDAAPETLYDLWADSRNLPRFMSHVEEVRDLGDNRQHWAVSGPGGTRVEWNAIRTRAERPKLLSWRTEPGSAVQHAGSVQFEPDDGGTRVTVRMVYNGAGVVGHAVATLSGVDPKRQLDDDLARMKTYLERGVAAYEAAPSSPEGSPRPAEV